MLLSKSDNILSTSDIRLKVLFVFMARRTMNRCQIENDIISRRREGEIKRFADIQPDVFNPFNLFNDTRDYTLFSWHYYIKIIDHIARSDAFFFQHMDKMSSDKPGAPEDDVVHCMQPSI